MDPEDLDDCEPDVEPDWFQDAADQCGQLSDDGGCMLAGTEYCDFECPFRG